MTEEYSPESSNTVVIPPIDVHVSEETVEALKSNVDPLRASDFYGVDLYQLALNIVECM